MPNPLFNLLGGGMQTEAPIGNFQHVMNEFQKFKNNFQGDPKAEVERLLQSGQMSQQQLNQLQQAAQMFQNVLSGI